ncbi:GtrA family protein [Stygiolobus caldivivus]|uniref:Sugar translocase n=1 Tax=Stygiolobus caldivivus TaxID=2824673 RepID=A0A8D5ZG92_9CREN|nr:GtrA family protein [Stygiolobus caldivivus]BCU70753.1 sugar translocase [Stygiolobus caldivivus]
MLEKIIKYSIVGGIGTIVNEGILLALKPVLPIALSLALAIEVSILSNFLLNDIWTFRRERVGTFIGRMLKFHFSSIIGGAVQYAVVIALVILFVHYASFTSLLFLLFFSSVHLSSFYLAVMNFIGIIAGFGVRFILSIKYVWA